jgi:hypothetical protein
MSDLQELKDAFDRCDDDYVRTKDGALVWDVTEDEALFYETARRIANPEAVAKAEYAFQTRAMTAHNAKSVKKAMDLPGWDELPEAECQARVNKARFVIDTVLTEDSV